jgi:hypothetical protein
LSVKQRCQTKVIVYTATYFNPTVFTKRNR